MEMEVKGLKEVSDKLKALPDEVLQKYLPSALREGAGVVLDAARALAPVDHRQNAKHPGAGRDGLHINVETVNGQSVAKVSNSRDQYYMLMVDRGWITAARYKGGMRNREGRRAATLAPGDFFMERAVESSSEAAVEKVAEVLKTKIEKGMRGRK